MTSLTEKRIADSNPTPSWQLTCPECGNSEFYVRRDGKPPAGWKPRQLSPLEQDKVRLDWLGIHAKSVVGPDGEQMRGDLRAAIDEAMMR